MSRTLELDYKTVRTLLRAYVESVKAYDAARIDISTPNTVKMAFYERQLDMEDIFIRLVKGLPVTVSETDLRCDESGVPFAAHAAIDVALESTPNAA